MTFHLDTGQTIIWGVGSLYHKYKDFLRQEFSVGYVYDRKLDIDKVYEYEGYRVISLEDLKASNCLIILCINDKDEMDRIEASLGDCGARIQRLTDIIPLDRILDTEAIKDTIHNQGE